MRQSHCRSSSLYEVPFRGILLFSYEIHGFYLYIEFMDTTTTRFPPSHQKRLYARRQLLDSFFPVDFGISKDAIVLLVSSLLGGSLCKNMPSSQSHQFKDEVKPRLSIPSKKKPPLNSAFIVEKSKDIPVLELACICPQLFVLKGWHSLSFEWALAIYNNASWVEKSNLDYQR